MRVTSLLRSVLVGGTALVVAAAGLSAVANPAEAAARPRPIVTGWLPYWSASSAATDVRANRDLFTEAMPFWYSATGVTSITSQTSASTRSAVIGQLRSAGLRVIPSVTDGTPARTMAGILASPTKRAQHVSTLVALVVSNGYDGIDLDYEKFAFSDGSSTWATTRPAWVAFVKQLATALHARGRLLSVTTPVMYDASYTSTAGYWVYDWRGIAASVDRLRIMAYDYSVGSPGPIAPLSWVQKVAKFAVTQVPAGKVFLGVPAYGRDWVTAIKGTCPAGGRPGNSSLTASQAIALAAAKKVALTWDAGVAERTFSYSSKHTGAAAGGGTTTCTATHRVWYSDYRAVVARAHLVGTYHLGGISMWSLGGEDARQWPLLRSYASSIAPRPTKVTTALSGVVPYGGPGTVVARLTVDGAALAGAQVVVSARPVGSSTWTTVGRGTTGADGRTRTTVRPKVNTTYRVWAVPGWGNRGAVVLAGTMKARQKLVMSATALSVKARHPVTVSGVVVPRVAGRPVVRMRLVAGRWVQVGTARTAADGSVQMVFSAMPGTNSFRFYTPATSRNAPGWGPVVQITAR